MVRYKAGAKWWLDDNDPADVLILAMARREQGARVGATFWSEIAADLAERLVRGELIMVTGGAPHEVFPVESFSVDQMRVWLSVSSMKVEGQSSGEVAISDANWSRVTDGLKLAGWEARKSNGRMVWSLSHEKRDELCMLFGRGVGPTVSEIRRARRAALKESV